MANILIGLVIAMFLIVAVYVGYNASQEYSEGAGGQMSVLQTQPLADPIALSADRGAAVWWLGQAGFLIAQGGLRIVVDAYHHSSRRVCFCLLGHEHLA